MVTGTQIANEILEMYKTFCDVGQKVDFKNVQRRVYDALNVLSAMDIIRKDKYNIIYNHYNEHIPTDYGTGQEDNVTNDGGEESSGEYDPQGARGPMLTEDLVQVKEKECLEQKRRVREKQKLLLELVKQHVAITKLK